MLFEPIKLGKHKLKNRIIMPAMDTNLSNGDGTVSDRLCDYFEERAKGGVGLIITEITAVDYPQGTVSTRQLQLTTNSAIPGFRNLAERVHPYGTKVLAQLHHAGLKSPGLDFPGERIVSCSDFELNGRKVYGLTAEEIEHLTDRFASAARRAQKSGLDGVEIHAGHGYLVGQFLSRKTNTRADSYGGDVVGRSKFLVDIIRKIRKVCGSDLLLSVRLGAMDFVPGGNSIEDGIALAKILDQENIDLLNLTTGIRLYESDNVETQEKPDGNRTFLGEKIKEHVKVPVAVVGKIRTRELCEDILTSRKADMVCVGRQLICDPYWPEKLYYKKEDEVRRCLNCSEGCFGNIVIHGSELRCAINPFVGLEGRYSEKNPATTTTTGKILVVGGGVAGMQAAATLSDKGHDVLLVEKEPILGGQLNYAAVPDDKEILLSITDYYTRILTHNNVEVRLNTPFSKSLLNEYSPDYVLIATGSTPARIPVKGNENAAMANDVLAGEMPENQKVVIIGGGNVGCELGIWLAAKNEVIILEMLSQLANGQEYTHKARDMRRIKERSIQALTNVRVKEICTDRVVFEDEQNQIREAEASLVIIAAGQISNVPDAESLLLEKKIPFSIIGDAMQTGNIRSNVRSGFFAANAISLTKKER